MTRLKDGKLGDEENEKEKTRGTDTKEEEDIEQRRDWVEEIMKKKRRDGETKKGKNAKLSAYATAILSLSNHI